MTDEFAETDEWPAPQRWMRHQAETGLVPPIPATHTPASDRVVWRDRGERIAALEAENERLRSVIQSVRAEFASRGLTPETILSEGNQP